MGVSQDDQKYNSKVRKIFVNSLMKNILSQIVQSQAINIIDIGCGEGFPHHYFLNRRKELKITGVDLNKESINKAKNKNPQASYWQGDIYSLKVDSKFDLVLVMEVLEHLRNPQEALFEVKKVAPLAIFSVPHEPWFSFFSFVSGKYLKTWGKHPDHLNFWNRASLKQILKNYYSQVKVYPSFPWLMAVCRK